MKQLKNLKSVMSPASWGFVYLGGIGSLLVVLRPSWKEIGVLVLVSQVSLVLMFLLERFLVESRFPQWSPKHVDIDIEHFGKLSFDQRVERIEWMARYAPRRSLYFALGSGIKAIPEFLVVVFFWQHPESSNLGQFLLVSTTAVAMWCYCYGIVFVESHDYLSRKLAVFHERFDLRREFLRANVPMVRGQYTFHENVSIVSSWICILLAQCFIALRGGPPRELAVQLLYVGSVGLGVAYWLWYRNRSYMVKGLETLFFRLEKFDPESFTQTLPLHTSPLLAKFESTFNSMMERLKVYQRELSHRVFVKTEESRYQALGEIAGLVVHDLSTPLQVVRFCVEQLSESPDKMKESRYRDQLERNSARAIDLVESLRAYLKNPKKNASFTYFGEAHEHVLRLLEVRFFGQPEQNRVEWTVERSVNGVPLGLTKADLIHVLMNVFSNSYENMISAQVQKPGIEVTLVARHEGSVVLGLRDRGTGLSKKRFVQLTSLEQADGEQQVHSGLGLRLVCRLVEKNGGRLEVVDLPAGEPGTLFHLTLRSLPVESQQAETNDTRAHT